MQVIYLKEQFGNAVFYKPGNNGEPAKPVPFHEVGDDIGGIKLDDALPENQPLIDALNQMITDRVGGVYLATEAQYDALKKKPVWRPSNPASEPLKVFQPNRRQPVTARPEDVAAAADQPLAQPNRPIPSLNPVVAADLTRPGKPAVSPAESGAEPPAAPPVNLKPRVGRASVKSKPATETAPATA